MADTDTVFAGSIPDLYERYFVPLIFQPYADDIAARLARHKPSRILETAAGTGVVTRAMIAALPQAQIVATDLNPPMLVTAQRLTRGTVEWQPADALALPFDDQSFDAVVCQFGAMFFPDRVKAYKEARRVLNRGGHFLFNAWGPIADNVFTDVVVDSLAELFPADPPRFLARTPHGYHDPQQIRADVAAAGFSDISIEIVDHVSRAPSPRDAAIALCQGTPMRAEIEARDPAGLEKATDHAAAALAKRFGNGAIEGRISALVIEASR
jgi:ubiquinone/menaquinone biosynthesis C-methylase UbiE